MRIASRNTRTLIFSMAAVMSWAYAHTGLAAGTSRLPIDVGSYFSDSGDDCGGPTALSWDGKAFLADFVYIDNITAITKSGENQYEIASHTNTKDDNTKVYGYLWH